VKKLIAKCVQDTVRKKINEIKINEMPELYQNFPTEKSPG
jgi:hypothetical protein